MANNSYEIIIIGAGIIGCTAALELGRRGASVLIIEEKSGLFQGASQAGFGSLTPFSDPFFVDEARDFAAKSVQLYRSKWIQTINAEADVQIPFIDLGLIELCETDADFAKARKHAENLQKANYTNAVEVLTIDETRKREPNLSGEFAGALWLDEPWLDAQQYLSALEVCIARNKKITLRTATQVVRTTNKLSTVEITTSTGEVLNSRWVIICTGLSPAGIENIPNLALRWNSWRCGWSIYLG